MRRHPTQDAAAAVTVHARLSPVATAFVAIASCALAPGASAQRVDAAPAWPAITAESRPWTRWWWQGSAVNPTDLTRNLEAYQRAGLGGVEVTPIYGVRGAEHEFIPYLSPKWVSMLEHTLTESKRLGLGVDMATGTGWPFGGPNIGDADAAKYVAWKRWTLRGGERLRDSVAYTPAMLVRSVNRRPSDDSRQIAVRDPIASAYVPCVQTEEWLYERGPGEFVAVIRMRGGKVQSITYGRQPQ